MTSPVQRAREARPVVRPLLLRWFDRSKRDLPWRKSNAPYGVWVSEVMLQQTQVERVVRYWTKFLERFPTVKSLAAAELKDVLGLWTGLGYYSRARNLHLASKELVLRFGGELPDSVDALLTLPGFGRYTAGAVASIAFELEAPLVDGNVARVLSRLLELDGVPGEKTREAALWAAAEVMVEGARPGDWNQALMELGATVCVPQNPLCLVCPVRTSCRALAAGRVDELPRPKKPPKRKRLEFAVAVARRGQEVLLARREEKGLFGGLWELPGVELAAGADGDAALQKFLGKKASIGPELTVVERTLTHRDLVLRLHAISLPKRLAKPPAGYLEWRWVPRAEIGALGMSSAMQGALAEAG
ncbi:MAG: A/G-specific adenine glycosylase [Archangium sp.]|nr:A/G-specific adenine glycosylase [Archangium sp.]